MKESLFKKNRDKIRANAHFTKNDAPVSSFPEQLDKEKLLSSATRELGALLSGLKAGGIAAGSLEVAVLQCEAVVTVSIKGKSEQPLGFNEINLICKIANELGISVKITDGGVEVIPSLPMLESLGVYAEVMALVKEYVEAALSEGDDS